MNTINQSTVAHDELMSYLEKGLCRETLQYLSHSESEIFKVFREKFGEEALYSAVRNIAPDLLRAYNSKFSPEFLLSKGDLTKLAVCYAPLKDIEKSEFLAKVVKLQGGDTAIYGLRHRYADVWLVNNGHKSLFTSDCEGFKRLFRIGYVEMPDWKVWSKLDVSAAYRAAKRSLTVWQKVCLAWWYIFN